MAFGAALQLATSQEATMDPSKRRYWVATDCQAAFSACLEILRFTSDRSLGEALTPKTRANGPREVCGARK